MSNPNQALKITWGVAFLTTTSLAFCSSSTDFIMLRGCLYERLYKYIYKYILMYVYITLYFCFLCTILSKWIDCFILLILFI